MVREVKVEVDVKVKVVKEGSLKGVNYKMKAKSVKVNQAGGTVLLHLGLARPGRLSSLGQIRSNDAAARAPADFSADRGSARSCTGAGACGGHPHVGPGGPGGHVQRQGDQGGEGGG